MTEYLALFGVAFAAATVLPFYSEVAVTGMVLNGSDPWLVWAWATAGNTLGALLNYLLARYLLHYQDRKWFPVSQDQLAGSQRWFNRYGVWSLLLAWAPVGGDALTFVAGIMKVRLATFLLLVALGKGARYAAIIWLVS
ncbi:MAG: YqaA family protein [Gammaproteobacteria bacterium]|nr:YqaA family protein [Gammaproteobacteria bacterium]